MTDPTGGSADNSGQPEPPAEAVAEQLERVLASRGFAQSVRMKRFLRFVVEETLAGRGASLKEYTIALEVFERDDSFNPQTSSVVRVEASRLRAKLENYNAVDGQNDPVRILLPPGGYLPAFHWADRDAAPAAQRRDSPALRSQGRPGHWRFVALAAIIVAAVPLGAFLLTDFGLFRSVPEAVQPAETVSLAVLPLRDLSAAGTDDYFSAGMTDALITRLAQGGSVRVTSMTSVMGYKDVDRPLTEIARELGVSHIIEGSVLRVGDKIRITAQLIEAASDDHIWADSYDRNFADVLALQDEVVGQIVASLSQHVEPAGSTVPKESAAIDPAAYEANLKGRFFLNKLTEEGFRKGIAYFKEVIEKSPEFAPAHSGMATCYCLLGGHGFEIVKPSEGMPTAKAAVLEALRLDDSLAEPHAFLGIIRLKYEWDWPGAEEAFKHSIDLNPSYAQARVFYSFFLEAMGRQKEAIAQAEVARSIDPLSPAANVNLGWQYLQAGRLEKALRQFDSTAELDPNFWGVHWGLGHYHRQKGDHGAAIAAFQKAVDVGGGHVLPLTDLGYSYAVSGKAAEAKIVLDRLIGLAAQSYVSPFNMAVVHTGLGEAEEAFAWLEKAYADRSRSMAWLKVSRDLDGLRADPRFNALLHRIGLPE